MKKPPKRYWKTRDGKKLLISDMTDSHLLNALNLIEKHFSDFCNEHADRIRYYAAEEEDHMFEPDYCMPTELAIAIELEKRAKTLEGIEIVCPAHAWLKEEFKRRVKTRRIEATVTVEAFAGRVS
jgi:hypothetical protein